MRPAYIFLLSSLLFSSLTAQWEILNEGETTWLIDKIDFVNDDIGYSSNFRNLIKTTDFGITWSEIQIANYEWGNINDFDFIDESAGWVLLNDYSAEETWLFFTQDGGNSWQLKSVFAESSNVNDMKFIDDNIGYAILHDNESIKTTNGGETWIDISPQSNYNRFNEIIFTNSESGFIIAESGKFILRTSDGGENWNERSTNLLDIWDICIKNDSTIYFTAWDETNRLFCVTQDNFNTWKVKSRLRDIGPFGLSSDDTIHAIVDGNFAVSGDSGSSWQVLQKSNQWGYGDFYFNSNNEGLLTSVAPLGGWESGRINFRLDKKKNKWVLSFLTYSFQSVHFINDDIGFAAGGESVPHWTVGDIFMTCDGGKSWDLTLSPGNPVNSFSFIDENTGFALSSSGWGCRIYKTTTGGQSWSPVSENFHDSDDFEFHGNDLVFKDENSGWAAGYDNEAGSSDPESFNGAILATVDGGENWDLVWKHAVSGTALNSIHVSDSTLWAVGDKGTIVKSNGTDSYETRSGITDLPLNDVFFSDENNGWIAGGIFDHDKYHILLRTTDGGENWITNSELGFQINDMYFSDSLHGWAAGNGMWDTGGVIMETFDGGLTWKPQAENLSSSLKSFHFNDGYGWAVGERGLILKSEGVTWVDQRTGKEYPQNFSLSQNYPNPFNPTTTINYNIPAVETGHTPSLQTSLIVYDILGKEVATLVNGNQRPGKYEVVFDAGRYSLSSGVYFYKLEVGKFSETRKFMLLK